MFPVCVVVYVVLCACEEALCVLYVCDCGCFVVCVPVAPPVCVVVGYTWGMKCLRCSVCVALFNAGCCVGSELDC